MKVTNSFSFNQKIWFGFALKCCFFVKIGIKFIKLKKKQLNQKKKNLMGDLYVWK